MCGLQLYCPNRRTGNTTRKLWLKHGTDSCSVLGVNLPCQHLHFRVWLSEPGAKCMSVVKPQFVVLGCSSQRRWTPPDSRGMPTQRNRLSLTVSSSLGVMEWPGWEGCPRSWNGCGGRRGVFYWGWRHHSVYITVLLGLSSIKTQAPEFLL